jgi:hypothetical protein
VTIAKIIAELVERGEDDIAEELMLLAQSPSNALSDAEIDAELDEAAEAAGPHLFAVDCIDWPSSKKPDYKPWKEAVKEWAQSGPKNCEILDKEGEPLPEKVAFKAARKFGVMRAELDDAEIDAALDMAVAGKMFSTLLDKARMGIGEAKSALDQLEGLFVYKLFGDGSKDRFTNEPALDEKTTKEAKKIYDLLMKIQGDLDKGTPIKALEKHVRWLDSNMGYM